MVFHVKLLRILHTQQMALKAEFEAADESDGCVFEELGECSLALDRAPEAQPFFAKAFETLSQDAWFTEKEPVRLARLKQLGKN